MYIYIYILCLYSYLCLYSRGPAPGVPGRSTAVPRGPPAQGRGAAPGEVSFTAACYVVYVVRLSVRLYVYICLSLPLSLSLYIYIWLILNITHLYCT